MSIHRGSDGPRGGAVSSAPSGPLRRWIPYSDNAVAFAAAFVVLLAFGIYLRTMLPSTGFWDTGEAQTVPPTLSIFHPTGFPVYAMLGWLWSQLPIGEVAWRMNLLSGVSVALAGGFVTLAAGHLIGERDRALRATAAGIAGASFAFASEPWENATRADVHALSILSVTVLIWLLFTWRAAVAAASPRAGGWLVGAALTFGLGLGVHPLIGLFAFGIAAWLLLVDGHIWRRWRLVLLCALMVAIGIGTFGYIWLRAITDPEPPLFYARPDTWERFRYLVFAEQFAGLFRDFREPLADIGQKWADAERVLAAQFVAPGWLLVAVGAAVVAARSMGTFVVLLLFAVGNIVYSMNFRDGDIDRYYMPTIAVLAPLLGVALATIAAACAQAVAEVGRRLVATLGPRRVLASLGGALVLGLGALLPAASLVTGYDAHDQSQNRDADAWVASVYEQVPTNSVIVSWWSYSTPLWHHRWVLGERPDITIIDERNILDDGYRTMNNAIRAHYGERPVYVVLPDWERRRVTASWEMSTVPTLPGFTRLLLIEGPAT
ncbi:MAG: glycosyltransferase family 117 protein [Candidatus Limnocylindria bacterium]